MENMNNSNQLFETLVQAEETMAKIGIERFEITPVTIQQQQPTEHKSAETRCNKI
jgi:hypothetical protein